MVSQPEVADYDPAEILAETGIGLPALPEDWQVVDAQVFPSRVGHSVEIVSMRGTSGGCRCSRPASPSFGVIAPTVARSRPALTAYWQSGELVYALTGSGSDKAHRTSAGSSRASLR